MPAHYLPCLTNLPGLRHKTGRGLPSAQPQIMIPNRSGVLRHIGTRGRVAERIDPLAVNKGEKQSVPIPIHCSFLTELDKSIRSVCTGGV